MSDKAMRLNSTLIPMADAVRRKGKVYVTEPGFTNPLELDVGHPVVRALVSLVRACEDVIVHPRGYCTLCEWGADCLLIVTRQGQRRVVCARCAADSPPLPRTKARPHRSITDPDT